MKCPHIVHIDCRRTNQRQTFTLTKHRFRVNNFAENQCFMVITLYLFQLQYIIASDNLTGYKKNTPFSHFEYLLLYCAVGIYSNLQYILLRNLKNDPLTLYSASTFKVQRTLHDSSTFYRSWRHETIAIPQTIHRHFIGAGAMESSLYNQLSS